MLENEKFYNASEANMTIFYIGVAGFLYIKIPGGYSREKRKVNKFGSVAYQLYMIC